MAEALSNLLEDLTSSYPDGTPVLVLVDDYATRQQLADAIVDEARIFGVEVYVASRLEDAMAHLPTMSVLRDQAALLLIDAETAASFGPWLESAREALPQWVRFLVLLVLPDDVPALATTAPAFMSWAKSLEFRRLDAPRPLPGDEIHDELTRLKQATGMTVRQFIEAWRRGTLPDNFRNTTWLTLAWAAADEERDEPT